MTVSKDRCLRLWDLLGKSTAKGSSSTRLGAEGDLVRWNTKGDRFAVILDRELRIFTTVSLPLQFKCTFAPLLKLLLSQDMTPLRSFSSISRFHDVTFVEKDGKELLLVACEDGKVRIYKDIRKTAQLEGGDAEQQEHIAELVGFSNRCALT